MNDGDESSMGFTIDSFAGIGKYQVGRDAHASFYSSTKKKYFSTAGSSGVIEITEFDSLGHYVKGTFEFVLEDSNKVQVVITDGVIYLPIHD